MSYEKITGTPSQISFFYMTETLFDDASLRSMYKARNKVVEGDESAVEKFAITEDERDIHLTQVRDAVFHIFTKLLKYTKSIDSAISFNEPYEALATVAQLNALTSYNQNILYKMTDAGDLEPGTVTVAIDDLVYYDGTTWVIDAAAEKRASWVKIVDHSAYNENYIQSIDENIFKAVRFYVLEKWADIAGDKSDEASYNKLYLQSLRNMEDLAFQLKKVSLSS